MGYSPPGHKELDTTKQVSAGMGACTHTHTHTHLHVNVYLCQFRFMYEKMTNYSNVSLKNEVSRMIHFPDAVRVKTFLLL